MASDILLIMKDINKSFPGVHALKNASLQVRRGTVNVLMGENGAGKSTLMKILMGVEKMDSGVIWFDGEEYKVSNTNQAIQKGLTMIFQELSPVPDMKVYENIFLGKELTRAGRIFVDRRGMAAKTRALLHGLGMTDIDATAKMSVLSIAKTQMVEIAKAMSYSSKLIIMDEPTSSLTESESEQLFRIVQALKEKGISFIFITHKMGEVYRIADDITVMRDGEYICCKPAGEISQHQLIDLMVGREIANLYPPLENCGDDVLLSVRSLSSENGFDKISFDLHRGEVLGFAGLVGAGRTEVMETLFGYRKRTSGEVFSHGKKLNIRRPTDAIKAKMAMLTEDRRGSGILGPLNIRDNIALPSISRYVKMLFLKKRFLDRDCMAQIQSFGIRPPDLGFPVRKLSGGNQQKVLLGRWMLTDPDILILDEPTRGIDVGAKAEVYRYIAGLSAEGKGILLVSSELPEIIGLCHRVIVMHERRVTGILGRDKMDQRTIMEYATAIKQSADVELNLEDNL